MTVELDLPEEPVDQYQVVFYRISLHSSWFQLMKLRYLYHVNTSWSDVDSRPNGVDFVDQWSVYCNNNISGRIVKWKSILDYINDAETFPTVSDAVQFAFDRLGNWIIDHQKKIDGMVDMQRQLADVLTRERLKDKIYGPE